MFQNCPLAMDPRLVGDPVDTLTGASVERQRDFHLAGPLPLQWWRHYDSSLCHQRFSLGWGHAHDFDCELRFDQDGMRYVAPLGRPTYFPPLLKDGASFASGGRVLRRLSEDRYLVHEHGSPHREFKFSRPEGPAKLSRLFLESHRIEFEYDHRGFLSLIVDSLNNALRVEVGSDGLLRRIEITRSGTRESQEILAYEYDERGNLILGRDGFGGRFGCHYDQANRMIRRTDRLGYSFEFTYDSQGRCTRTAGADGLLEYRLDYTIPGQLTRVTRGNGGVWEYYYQQGQLIQIIDPLGGLQQFARDGLGRIATEIDSNGNVTKYVLDEAGGTIGKLNCLGHFRATPEDFNAPGPLAHRVARNPLEFEYGRLIDLPAPTVATGLALDAKSHETGQSPYEASDRRANLFTDANLGFVGGRNWWPAPASGRRFDTTGDLIHQIDAHGRMRRWRYDANGNVVKYVDFDGGVWSYEYRSWNHRIRETNPQGVSHSYVYDSREKLATFVDAGGTRTDYVYDLKDKLTLIRRHGAVRDRYQRDACGNVLAKYAADGRWLLKFEIAKGNLPAKCILASGETYSYQYDEHGMYVLAGTGKDVVEFEYDAFGNRCVEKRNGQGVAHKYHRWPQFAESVWLDRFNIRYDIGQDGTLIVIDPCGGRQQICELSAGKVERRFSSGTVETAVFDEVGRCQTKSVAVRGSPPWNRTYEWSGEGELRRVADSLLGVTNYEYDAAHRLVKRVQPGGKVSHYELDMANNLIRQPGLNRVELQEGNRLAAANGGVVAYNDRNHISEQGTPEGTTHYFYDSRDQLVRVESPRGVWEADYDGLGRRVRKTFNGQVTEYLWNTDQLAGEIAPDGRLRLYIYTDLLALTPMIFVDYESTSAAPESGRRYFVFSDQIGAPIRVEDEQGREVWQAGIEPFGMAVVAPSAAIMLNLRFPGHYWDDDIRLNYNRFRFYDPQLGRYIQSDPLGIAGGPNLYAYPANPLDQVDVRGLAKCATCGEEHPDEAACPQDYEENDHTNSAGETVPRTLVDSPDHLIQAAEAVVGNMNGWKEYKPNWFESPDGRTHVEINHEGHANTNEGPHVTVRRLDDDSGRYTAENKIFVAGWEQHKRDWANFDWNKYAEDQNK